MGINKEDVLEFFYSMDIFEFKEKSFFGGVDNIDFSRGGLSKKWGGFNGGGEHPPWWYFLLFLLGKYYFF